MKVKWLEELTWQDVRGEVASKNPEFAQAADHLNPEGDFKVYKVRYPFGCPIIKNGIFHLPVNGVLMAINDAKIPAGLSELNYNYDSAPLAMLLDRSAELSIYTESRLIPFKVLKPGDLFALWTILDPPVSYHNRDVWYLTAGARNLFVVPKIKDFYSYKRLCRSRGILRLGIPNTLIEQYQLLLQMTQHADYPPWHCEVLLFSAKWLEVRNDSGWYMFRHYLYQYAWQGSSYWRNKFLFNTTWDSFVMQCSRLRIKIGSQAADIVKHLLASALGAVPSFKPALDDEQGPIAALQKDFYEIYGLDRYVATIMTPCRFSLEKSDGPVYWAFRLPSYFESTPHSSGEKTLLSLIHEVYELLVHFCEMGLSGKLLGMMNTPIYSVLNQARFDFFHSGSDAHSITKPVSLMAQEDKRFLQCPPQYGTRGISEMGPFVRGCVRIRQKD